MRRRHQRTLRSLLRDPPGADLAWRDVESLLVSLGAEIAEGRGSRVRVALGGRKAVIHRPHPSPTIGRGTARAIRKFLEEAGVDAP